MPQNPQGAYVARQATNANALAPLQVDASGNLKTTLVSKTDVTEKRTLDIKLTKQTITTGAGTLETMMITAACKGGAGIYDAIGSGTYTAANLIYNVLTSTVGAVLMNFNFSAGLYVTKGTAAGRMNLSYRKF